MFNGLSILLAVTLSLVSTNDYTYTHPNLTTNEIKGIGIGESGDYLILRAEDIAFLKEAMTERSFAVRGYAWRPEYPEATLSVKYPLPSLSPYLNFAFLFPESFDSPYITETRGENPSFVGPGFDLANGGVFIECDSDWQINIRGTNYNLRTSYTPLVGSYGTRITPPNLRTNSFVFLEQKILSIAVLTNHYHNLDLCGRIINGPITYFDFVGETYRIMKNYGAMRYFSYDENGTQTITYRNPVFQESYYYSLPISREEEFDQTWRSEIDWDWDNKCATSHVQPARQHQAGYVTETHGTPYVYAGADVITTNVLDLCSNIKACVVYGLTYTQTKTTYSTYCEADMIVTNYVKRGFISYNVSVNDYRQKRKVDENGNVVVLFSLDTTIKTAIDDAWKALPTNVRPTTIFPNSESVPSRINTDNESAFACIDGRCNIKHKVTVEWMRVWFTFDRDYRAKVLN